jgi:hypothetical protein
MDEIFRNIDPAILQAHFERRLYRWPNSFASFLRAVPLAIVANGTASFFTIQPIHRVCEPMCPCRTRGVLPARPD